jgi:hypothetical protein
MQGTEPAEHIEPCPASEQRKGSVDAKKRMDEDDMHVTVTRLQIRDH